MRYYATVCTGLESIAAMEIRERIQGVASLAGEPGHVLFDYEGPPGDLFGLRSVNHLCTYLGKAEQVTATRDALCRIQDLGERLDLQESLGALRELRDLPDDSAISFRVSADRSGKHDFTSHEVAAALGEGVRRSTGWRVNLTSYDVDVRADLDQDRLVLGCRLTEASLHRRNLAVHGRATLKPTVAYALIRMADPQPGHVLVDPMCGGATILIEARQVVPDTHVMGGDLDCCTLCDARTNRAACDMDFPLMRWDARSLPFPDRSVDRLIANMPFGVRVGSHRKNRPLYRDFVAETNRTMAPEGRMVLLTLERRLMAGLLPRYPRFDLIDRISVNIGGLVPSAFVVRCRD